MTLLYLFMSLFIFAVTIHGNERRVLQIDV